jgi:chromate transporter
VPLLRLLRVWFLLGLQSFGGGTATLFLIRRAVVEQQRWLTPDEFTRDWSLCFMAPGINLLCLTILVGRRVAGAAGALVALLGLLLPSVGLTLAMTAVYAQLKQIDAIQAALRGLVPATVGLGLLLAVDMVRPLLTTSRAEGRGTLGVSVLLLLATIAATALWNPPVVVLLLSAGIIGGVAAVWRAAARSRP